MEKRNLQKKIRNKVVSWNNKFPLDYWWRKKHSISYGSEQHREANYLDMLFEYEEDKLMLEASRPEEDKNKPTQQEVDKEFDDLDIESFNTK